MTEDQVDPEVTLEGEANDAQATQEAPAVGPAEVEAEAAKYGWKPREKWKGDASGWVDAPAYLERSKTLLPVIQGQLANEREARERERAEFNDRMARMERVYEETRKREVEKAREEAAQAKANLDFDAFERAQARIAAAQEVPKPVQTTPEVDPVVRSWTERNPWFDADPDLRATAIALADERKALPVVAQLAYVDREMARLFPDRVKPVAAPARTFAPVDGGGLVAPKRTRAATDLPPEARAAGEKFVREGLYKSLDEYATDYWSA